ncbi:MAG: hypothetical protein A4E70_00475 [Syntrophus sp. PtaU1.Bin005]|mgnify:CR=1 FL=1|uniref:hypothetical protein n=1 Tax=Syntrophus sp. (in: bacteria) TaxID=48412 RepID=UPI0009D0C4C9|nr:MAG: hypothetical protein A4E69_00944 [Syntrophus sp. PtaB.Bin138]OPY83005.1 MAG: hypothetical protein A4E70_00475 [Syntrophus sp. PtaU1.Bin005]
MPAIYFFEVVWKVACFRKGAWKTGKCTLRSAVREFSDSLLLFGPDLVEVENPYVRPDLGEIISWSEENVLSSRSSSGYCSLPLEPRIMLASHGRRIQERQTLYELWEDSGLQSLSANLFFIEPLIFCHAFKTLINHTREDCFCGPPNDSREYDYLTAEVHLCVKKKSPKIETVLSSDARIAGKRGLTFGMDLYGNLRHAVIAQSAAQSAARVPGDGSHREKPVPGEPVPPGGLAKAEPGRDAGVAVRAPAESGKDCCTLSMSPEEEPRVKRAPPALASGFLAHMTFYDEPSGLLWIF